MQKKKKVSETSVGSTVQQKIGKNRQKNNNRPNTWEINFFCFIFKCLTFP